MLKSRYIMIGGFLGAGKTTSIVQLANLVASQNLTVGLITNDQSVGLVDTALLRSKGFDTEEITGGCFCCRFNSLVQAADNLSATDRPDVFIAEPVGSCTDLRATVSYPLQRIYGEQFVVAPLSVVLDPIRTRRVLGLDTGKSFSPKVQYIFEKQLEESDILVINKCDLLEADKLDELHNELTKLYPAKTVLRVSARSGEGIKEWLEMLIQRDGPMLENMEIDYDEYAEGESLLGWLNLSVSLNGPEFDGNALIGEIARHIQNHLSAENIEIAHLKMTLTPDSGNDLAVGNLVRTKGDFEHSHELVEGLEAGELIVNLRAEGDPEILKEVVEKVVAAEMRRSKIDFDIEHLEAFKPGRPVPTHRISDLS